MIDRNKLLKGEHEKLQAKIDILTSKPDNEHSSSSNLEINSKNSLNYIANDYGVSRGTKKRKLNQYQN